MTMRKANLVKVKALDFIASGMVGYIDFYKKTSYARTYNANLLLFKFPADRDRCILI